MDLNKITARVRPRNPYEAADLGILMARQWFRPLMLLWLLSSLPVMLVLCIGFHHQPLWALLILWWLKPLWETLQLQFIAEALFNPQVNWRDFLRKAPRLMSHQLLPKLFLHRWSPSRSFNMPVGELERLGGKIRGRRLSILHRNASSASIWLTLMGNSLESLLLTAAFVLGWMLIPMEMTVDFRLDDIINNPFLFPAVTLGGYLAMWIVSPFYVCCGFMLYINRRTWLEAWDIELSFRQLAAKASPAPLASALLLCALLGFGLAPLSQPARAAETDTLTPKQSQQQISEILEGPDFNQIKTKEGLRWIDPNRDKPQIMDDNKKHHWYDFLDDLWHWLRHSSIVSTLLDWAAGLPRILEILMYGLVAALLIFLLYQFRNYRAPEISGRRTRHDDAPPTHLFGLALNRESLPDDLIAAATALWQQQQTREAMSLLYRGALSFLLHERRLPLEDSFTEDECVALCRRKESAERSAFFQQLTVHWVGLAYGHFPPDSDSFTRLCEHWPDFIRPEAAS